MSSSVPHTRPAPEPLGPEVTRIAIVVLVGTFMSILDTTIVNVALDRLSIDFHTGFQEIQWIVTAYMLAMAAVIPLSGWVAVRFGPKPIFIGSAAAFTLASALCGFAWSLGSLVAFRVIQGAAGGLLMPVGQMMLARAAGPHRMGRVMSIVAVPMLIAPVLGPVLGGFLVDSAGWEWIFYVNVPVGITAVILAMRLLPRNTAGPSWPLDVVGVLLMAIGIPAITYGLAETGIKGTITAPTAWLPIVAGVVLTTVYAAYALRRERPLLNVRLFSNTAFSAASITAFALGGALFGGMILLPLYEQGLRGHSAMETGLLLMPQGMGAALAAPISGRLTDKVGGGIVAVVGLTVLIISTIPFTRLTADTPPVAHHGEPVLPRHGDRRVDDAGVRGLLCHAEATADP
ncbi:MAG: DHA2 family efflux MFS transporter permease subunit [Thermoleophilia bacterium]